MEQETLSARPVIRAKPQQYLLTKDHNPATPGVQVCMRPKESDTTFPDLVQTIRRDHPMKNEGASEMVLQTMVALLAMGLAVLSLMFMGRWV